ncbi:MAG: hypothetical protein HQK54_10150 [Oligoflexales bacterium]|nr:hypothetical protein [Oligoflexales bacterium]
MVIPNVRDQKKLPLNFLVSFLFLGFMLLPFWLNLSTNVEISNVLSLPSKAHPLGTDNLGRDLMFRLSEAIFNSVFPMWGCGVLASFLGIVAALVSIVLDTGPGLHLFVRIWNVFMIAIASVPIGITVFGWSALHEKAGILPVLSSLTVLFTVKVYLYVNELYRKDKNIGYWQANEIMGGSLSGRIIRYGILMKWMEGLGNLTIFHLKVGVAIEASLSYLGFGVQEPKASFGNMMSAHFDTYLKGNWYILALVLAVFLLTVMFPENLLLAARYMIGKAELSYFVGGTKK